MGSQGKVIRALNLSFGGACNKHCSYCLQSPDVNNKKGDPSYFLKEFKKYVDKKNIEHIQTIHYWGGEPMLYWNIIKSVLNGLDKMFPNVKMHRITTNGTIVNEDYVNFCNSKENIHTVVSLHDCDLSDEQWRLLCKIKHLCVTGLFYKQHPTPFDYLEEWERISRVTGRPVSFGIYPLHSTDKHFADAWPSVDDVDSYFDMIEQIALPLSMMGYVYYQKILSNLVFDIKVRLGQECLPKCFNDTVLSIDLFGNRFCCHHNETKENTIENIFKNQHFFTKQTNDAEKYFISKECQDCDALKICHGGCFLTYQHEIECRWEKRKWRLYQLIKDGLVNGVQNHQ